MADKEFFKTVSKMSPASSPSHSSPKKKEGKKEKGEEPTEHASPKKGESDEVNPDAIHGEPGTGFEPRVVDGVDKGPFECGNCEYFVGPLGAKGAMRGPKGCNQSDMKHKSKRPRLPDGRVELTPKDCCEYVDRLGPLEAKEKEKGKEKS